MQCVDLYIPNSAVYSMGLRLWNRMNIVPFFFFFFFFCAVKGI
jgi:hypothetical protein